MKTSALTLVFAATFALAGALLPATSDAGVVRLIAERDVPSTGQDLFLLSYPSLADMLAGTGLTQQSIPLPLVDSFSIAGATMDGAGIRMVAERDVPSTGQDFFLLSYASLADMLAGTGLTQQSIPLPLVDSFSIRGFFIESDVPPAAVPAPAPLPLLAIGLALLGVARGRTRAAAR